MRRLLLPLLVLLASCGDPLVEGDYRGQPLIELSGTIRVEDSLSATDADAVRVGLLWVGAAQQGDLTQGRSESSFPARYSMQVFARPPDRAMGTIPGREAKFGVARIVLYIDQDGDDQLDALEPIVGASPDQVLTYFTSSDPTSMVRGAVRTGYQVMELFACDDRLTDKATFGPVATQDAVDLTLATGVAGSLTDIDCDTVSDDFCFDLRLQVQEDPTNVELVSLYQEKCDVQFEPEFNNGAAPPGTDQTTNPTGNDSNTNAQPCDREPNNPDCQNPDNANTPDQLIADCKPLLTGAIGTGYVDQREAYWRFAQCTGEADPCRELGWLGGEEGWMPYQICTFDALPDHHEAWCRDVNDHMTNADGQDVEFYQSEFERGGCGPVI